MDQEEKSLQLHQPSHWNLINIWASSMEDPTLPSLKTHKVARVHIKGIRLATSLVNSMLIGPNTRLALSARFRKILEKVTLVNQTRVYRINSKIIIDLMRCKFLILQIFVSQHRSWEIRIYQKLHCQMSVNHVNTNQLGDLSLSINSKWLQKHTFTVQMITQNLEWKRRILPTWASCRAASSKWNYLTSLTKSWMMIFQRRVKTVWMWMSRHDHRNLVTMRMHEKCQCSKTTKTSNLSMPTHLDLLSLYQQLFNIDRQGCPLFRPPTLLKTSDLFLFDIVWDRFLFWIHRWKRLKSDPIQIILTHFLPTITLTR